ncbi:MAG: LysM peptidoglycan-binding domain-containing M23 family metallopeptidase [Hyphomicrobiales bacterium]|jgi:murein DD-endopeptidase MepM/ murein hydrolase activator NlpD|nr:LysM peptidoglycan-binding domain-containing M23 family metallopeptidase [Hyphomicrobiales bacterium]MBP9173746.1 LysM peptidoglycan-binding domain-containing M23 family metallopeptidase [Hyphomicrobiales bacterium]MCC7480024.1 LysM peptidoglycan-binding domain-containing M23 family metallopeptidase [Hyphomicrobiales bacterium]HRA93657.1 LysM peptidoglycan-binding domain-containing M23 family metallopeptidase [Aestuariivirga sp.]
MRVDSSAPKGLSKFNILASAALAVMLAACSNSVERFADNSSSGNPSDADPVYTASVPKKRTTYAPSYESSGDDKIISRPLVSAPLGAPNYPKNNYTYQKPAYKQPSYSEPTVVGQNSTTIPKGGTVRVEQGMTLYSISRANGVTVAQLAAANGISPPYTVSTGRVLRIPGVAQARAPKPSFEPQDDFASDEPVKKASGGRHTVRGGETLFSLGRKYGVSPYAIADLNDLPHDQTLNVGQSLRLPGGTAKSIVSKVPAPDEGEQIASADEPIETDDIEQNVALKKPALEMDDEVPVVKPVQQQVAAVDAAPTMGSMRWPVKGKIISDYGAKPNGLKNEGINIAVPEGTGVRAAESGVVAYAGNELKGYGNLVLIRHEGGWVTAYAHAKELFVKRGDIVKRGDVIAKAGQTGSVSSPQLHFEVRKGATAMDPLKFLASTTASN